MSVPVRTYSFQGFEGLRNDVGLESFRPVDLAIALNIDLDVTGRVRTRLGVEEESDTATHSLFGHGGWLYYAQSGVLYRRRPGGLPETLAVLQGAGTVGYVAVGDDVFWANGEDRGRVSPRGPSRWGISRPPPPALTLVAGDLVPGEYMVAVAYEAEDGILSGHSSLRKVVVGEHQGISVSVVGQPSDVRLVVYATAPNGGQLREVGRGNTGPLVYTHTQTDGPTPPLGEVHAPIPTPHLAYRAGRIWFGTPGVVWYTDPLAYHHIDLRYNYVPLPGTMNMLAVVPGALLAGTERETYRLVGSTPDEFTLEVAADAGVVPGSLAYMPADRTPVGGTGEVPIWLGTDGFVRYARPDGQIAFLTPPRYSAKRAHRAVAGVKIRDNSTTQYVVSLFLEDS